VNERTPALGGEHQADRPTVVMDGEGTVVADIRKWRSSSGHGSSFSSGTRKWPVPTSNCQTGSIRRWHASSAPVRSRLARGTVGLDQLSRAERRGELDHRGRLAADGAADAARLTDEA
jgi:hypothetical protein